MVPRKLILKEEIQMRKTWGGVLVLPDWRLLQDRQACETDCLVLQGS